MQSLPLPPKYNVFILFARLSFDESPQERDYGPQWPAKIGAKFQTSRRWRQPRSGPLRVEPVVRLELPNGIPGWGNFSSGN